jgi:hypothetical protein
LVRLETSVRLVQLALGVQLEQLAYKVLLDKAPQVQLAVQEQLDRMVLLVVPDQ